MKTAQLKTIGDFVRWASTQFAKNDVYLGHGSDSFWDEAVYLVLGLLKQPWDSDKSVFHCRLTEDEKLLLTNMIEKRIFERIPVPYILGEAWFCGLPFIINQHTLIPRSPIAELIQNEYEPWLPQAPTRILDMCTGSGCIGIASAMAFPAATVDLSDISKDALGIAEQNIGRFELAMRVNTIESNLFQSISMDEKYDLIVSNPPYVDAEDFQDMPVEYQHEPKLGLVSGQDGLDACRIILKEASNYLTDNGVLIVEVGNSAGALDEAYPEVGFSWIEFEQGGHGVFVLTKDELDTTNW